MAGQAQRHTSPIPLESEETRRVKAWMVHLILCEEYRCPVRFFHDMDPVSELVSSLLSHRTRNADSGRAFKALRERFPTWDDVAEAATSDVQQAIANVTWPEQKAPRIQHVLREIKRLRGDLSLDFLSEMTVRDARRWLEALPGVGPKTSAATLLFSRLRMPALPVDSHHHRVAQRVGLIPLSLGVGASHAVLEDQLPRGLSAQQVYDNHEVFMLHGQRCCYHHAPACIRCPVFVLCPTGQRLHPELIPDGRPERDSRSA